MTQPSDVSGATPEGGPAPGMPPDQEPSIGRRFFSVPTLLAVVVAGAFLVLAVWRIFDIDWAGLRTQVLHMNVLKYLLALVLYYASFLFRGLRWRLIARTAGFEKKPGVRLPSTLSSSAIILMGWFANSITFLRLGDAYRGYGFARESGGSVAESLGTVLAERVQDMGAVLLVLIAATVTLAFTHEFSTPGVVIGVAFGLVGGLMVGLVVMRAWGDRFAQVLPGPARDAYLKFQYGALASFHPRDLPLQLALGIAGWILEVARLYFVAEGIGVDVSFTVAAFAALANAMLSTIPTPGGFGFVEGGLAGLLILLGFSHTDAFAITLVDRSISWISVIVFGGLTFFLWHTFRDRGIRNRRSGPTAAPHASTSGQPSR